MQEHSFKVKLGVYEGFTIIDTEQALGLGDGQKYRICLFGKYNPNPYLIFYNVVFDYTALSKNNFSNEYEAREFFDDFNENDITRVLRKAKYSLKPGRMKRTIDEYFWVY